MSELEKAGTHPTTSTWTDAQPVIRPEAGSLPPELEVDVCIVGAGITGITTAYLLARAGRSVVVLDKGDVGAGETGRTSAHLASALDDRFTELEKLHGQDGARLAARSHAEAIDLIEAISRRESIDCAFERVDGYLYLSAGEERSELDEEAAAATRAGLEVQLLETPVGPALGAGPCLRFANQAQFHPLRYLAGLVTATEKLGARIYTGANVERFEAGGGRAHVTTREGRKVHADWLVVATNVPVNDVVVIHTKQAAYRSYMIALEIPRGAVPIALYWDTAEPYHFVRIERRDEGANDLLLVGGADHRTGEELHPEGRWDQLEAWTRERFPMAGALVRRWSGQVMEPIDGLAFIGRNPADQPNVFVATGDSGHGLTHGTIAASMFAAMIEGRPSVYESLYDPKRITLRSLPEFAKENGATAAHYVDWVRPGDAKSEDDIAPGEGATLLAGAKRLAVYRDEDGRCHRFSAAYKHLGGVVHWNAAEKTWDCPCHGARYDSRGRVLNGPALTDLSPADEVVTALPLLAKPVLV